MDYNKNVRKRAIKVIIFKQRIMNYLEKRRIVNDLENQ